MDLSWPTAMELALRVADRAASPFTDTFSRTGVLVLLAGWLIGAFAYAHYRPEGHPFSVLRYLRHAFHRSVWLTRSSLVDVQLLFFNRILSPARWLLLGLSVGFVAHWLADRLDTAFGAHQPAVPDAWGGVALALLLFLAYDFGTYVTHRMSHGVPVLWAFHRVHHSAEALNPLTVFRKHPVYDSFSTIIDCLIVAPLQALILHLWGADASAAVLALANLGFGWFAFAGSSLRHSHIWLSFGPVLDRIAVSPALHQVHHSRAREHWDCNYGEVLAVWDWMFGTLVRPQERVELNVGLADASTQPHGTLREALLEPFAYARQALTRRESARQINQGQS